MANLATATVREIVVGDQPPPFGSRGYGKRPGGIESRMNKSRQEIVDKAYDSVSDCRPIYRISALKNLQCSINLQKLGVHQMVAK